MSSPVAVTTDSAGGHRGVRPSYPGAIFAIIAAVGSLVAWSKWYPAEGAPISQSIRQAIASGSWSGTGLSISHGFGTTQGIIGLCAAIALFIAVALFGTRSTRVLGAGVLLIAAVALLVDGIVTASAANTAYNSWNNLPSNGSLFSSVSSSVAQAIARNSVLPAFGAAAAGVIALIGALRGIGGVHKSRRLEIAGAVVPASGPGPVSPPSGGPGRTAATAPDLPQESRSCPACGQLTPTGAAFCGACGANM